MIARTTVTDWLDAYGAAWTAHDGAAAGALFTDEAAYHWGPFDDPLIGPDAIAARWATSTAAHGIVAFGAELLALDGPRATARWWADLGAPGVRLDGAFVLDFAPDGRCVRLEEWWMSAPGSAAADPRFDLTAFRRAVEKRDPAAWLEFYAPDAVWTQVRAADPPHAPHVMRGHLEIGPFLEKAAAAPIAIVMSNEVATPERCAFTLTIERMGGARIVENVVCDLEADRIVRQLGVEAGD